MERKMEGQGKFHHSQTEKENKKDQPAYVS